MIKLALLGHQSGMLLFPSKKITAILATHDPTCRRRRRRRRRRRLGQFVDPIYIGFSNIVFSDLGTIGTKS
jgi:hypothetical protein